jgi:hypothetical protein
MAYLGNVPAEAYSSIDKQVITGDGGASYTLDHSVANENEIEVFVNNVRQEPSVAYTVSGTALTMTGDVEASDDFYVVFQGKAIQTTSHPEGQDLKARDGTFSGDLTVDTDTLHVDSTNNRVGIGGTPDKTLHVSKANSEFRIDNNGAEEYTVGTGTVDGAIFHTYYDRGGSTYIDSISRATTHQFRGSDGYEDMRIHSNGYVGIGTTSPLVGLSLQGNTADKATVQIKQTATGGRDYRLTSRSDGSFRINDDTGGATRLQINSNGTWGKAPSGTVIDVRTYENSTRTVLSNAVESNMLTFTDTKKLGTESKIVIHIHVPGHGHYSGSLGLFIEYDALRSYSAGFTYDNTSHMRLMSGIGVFTGRAAGSRSIEIGWRNANGGSGDRPFITMNPNASDDSRFYQMKSVVTVYEVIA